MPPRRRPPPPPAPRPTPGRLDPLATAEGSLRAQIQDAHLIFDADVTLPVRRGTVDFNQATVEHVGPDSRMGVSRLGIFVEAPNGRTYLYQFDAAPLAGVTLEQRGALFGAWSGDRGSLSLQPFVEALLRQSGLGLTRGVTEQARVLLGRTAVNGHVRLGDGQVHVPGLQTQLSAQGAGQNVVNVRSDALGRGVTIELPALSVRDTALEVNGARIACESATGQLTLQLVSRETTSFVLSVAKLVVRGLQVSVPQSANHSTQ